MRCFGARVDPIRHTPQTVPVLLDDLFRCTQCVRRVLLRLLHVYMYVRFNVLLFWLRCYMVAETNDLPDKTSELNYVHNHPRGSAEWASASRIIMLV